MQGPFRVAVAQCAPVFFDAKASVEKACDFIRQAAEAGAKLVAFGESWLPGYPFFVDAAPDATWWSAAEEYSANAVTIPGPEVSILADCAKTCGLDVVIGVAERGGATGDSIYCTLLFLSSDGAILGRHRKLKGTHNERAIWADGDADGLVPHLRPYGRLSGLNCWEHNLMLPGFALAAQGVDVHVAAWPGREPDAPPAEPVWARQILLSRAFASNVGAYVLCAAGLRRFEDTPAKYKSLALFEHNGASAIIDPRGEIIAGPLFGEGVLAAQIDPAMIRQAKIACDPAGHYSRPDLMQVLVRGKRVFGADAALSAPPPSPPE